MWRRLLHWLFLSLCAAILLIFAVRVIVGSPYQGWDYHSPETAVAGVALHTVEWLFVRAAPVVLVGAATGAFLTRKRA